MRVLVFDPYGATRFPFMEAIANAADEILALVPAGVVPTAGSATNITLQDYQDTPTTDLRGLFAKERARLRQRRERRTLLQRAFATFRPDVAIALDVQASSRRVIEAAAGQVPVVSFALGSDILIAPKKSRARHRKICSALRASAGVMVTSQLQAEKVKQLTGQSCFVVGGWVDCNAFRPGNLPENSPPLVLCMRGTRAVYRPEIVLKAIALARKSVDLRLRFRVEDGDLGRMQDVCRSVGMDLTAIDWVEGRVPYSAMPGEYQRCDLIVQAIQHESYGFTTVEAMASGRVVVQPRSGIALELLPSSQHDVLCGESAESMAASIVEILNDHNKRRALELANRDHALVNFDREKRLPEVAARLRQWLAEICHLWGSQ